MLLKDASQGDPLTVRQIQARFQTLKVAYLPCHVWQLLLRRNDSQMMHKNFGKILESELILMPICHESHWVLASINLNSKTILFLDSLLIPKRKLWSTAYTVETT